MNPKLVCPLCLSDSQVLIDRYGQCSVCDLRFLNPEHRLPREAEKKRYEQHQNNFDDLRYRNFLNPLASAIKEHCVGSAEGLDYGAGPSPVLAQMLTLMDYDMSVYDPFFYADPKVLAKKYDFVSSSEAVEHFFYPDLEFQRLRNLLKPNGSLAIMTSLYSRNIDFESWYYRKDPTHVVFYSKLTFFWIARKYNFLDPIFYGERVVILGT